MTMASHALVIGGGVAGAAMAAHLARAGRAVTLVERRADPHHKVCGEFVSGEAALYLRELAVDLAALGAVRVTAVRLHARRDVACVPLPFPALSLSRRVLDEALLRAAVASGAGIRRGTSVRALVRRDGRWIGALDDGDEICATDAFLATGKHDLRGWRRPPGRHGDFIAFKLHWRLRAEQAAALGSHVELFLFPGGYAGLEPVEDGLANLCLVVGRGPFADLGRRWDRLIAALRAACPRLDERLAGAEPCWSRPLAIAGIPYGHVHAGDAGPWRLGDQAAVIPSFAGDGIAIALHSARLAADCYASGATGAAFQARLARDIGAQVARAVAVSRLIAHPLGRAVAVAAAGTMPGLVGRIARATRIAHPLAWSAGST
jgi:flavin-dependent dehydrogenase